jgi:hypothetical protein
MPPSPPPPLGARPRKPRSEQAASDCRLAEAMLGRGHPLIAILRLSETVREQVWTVAGFQVAGVLLLWKQPLAVPLALAGGVVLIALGLRILCLESQKRAACRQLIIEGRERLPLPSMRRELRRLEDNNHRHALAGSIDKLANEASHPPRARPHPIYRPAVVGAVAGQLREIAALVDANDTPVRGVAHIEWLITAGQSPLYGSDVAPLREELTRARYLLTAHR